MESLIKVIAALMLMFFVIGCGEVSNNTNQSFKNAPTFKDAIVVKDGNVSYVVFNKNTKIKKSISNKTRQNTFSGKIALQSYLYHNMVDSYESYIIDMEGNYIEYVMQLNVGEEYTIVEYAFNDKYGIILSDEQSFIMSEEDISIELSLKIEPFYIEIVNPIENITKVYDITFGESINSGYVDELLHFTGFIGNEYELNDNYKMELNYSNIYNYLAFGTSIPIKKIAGMLSYGTNVNRVDFEDLYNGISLEYDPDLQQSQLSFSVKIEEDCFLYFNGDYSYQNYVEITYNKGDNQIVEFDGSMIPKGTILSINYMNLEGLSAFFYVEILQDNDIDLSILNELLEEEDVKR